jgi:chromosome segregation ATPase
MTEERVMTDRDSGPRRTDAEIVARSEAALRWEMSEEGELKRALWAAQAEINRLEAEVKRLNQLVKDEKYRTAKAREAASLLEIDVKNAYREIKQLKGGE